MVLDPNPNPIDYNLLLPQNKGPNTMHITERKLRRIAIASLKKQRRQAPRNSEDRQNITTILKDEVLLEAVMLEIEEKMDFTSDNDDDNLYSAGFDLKGIIQWFIDNKAVILAIIKLFTSFSEAPEPTPKPTK